MPGQMGNVTRTMPLETLLAPLPSPLVTGDARVPISGLTIDSRRVRPGDLFVALAGEKTDGLRFVGDALARGAAVLSDRPRPVIAAPGSAPHAQRPGPRRASSTGP
jgi:UDP-N-acetylmuramyl pentapeptide synthase